MEIGLVPSCAGDIPGLHEDRCRLEWAKKRLDGQWESMDRTDPGREDGWQRKNLDDGPVEVN